MPAKLKRCVEQVMAKGHSKSSAYAICVSSTGLKPHRAPQRKKKKATGLKYPSDYAER